MLPASAGLTSVILSASRTGMAPDCGAKRRAMSGRAPAPYGLCLAHDARYALQRAGDEFHELEPLAFHPARHLEPAIGGVAEAEGLIIGLVADEDADAVSLAGGGIEAVPDQRAANPLPLVIRMHGYRPEHDRRHRRFTDHHRPVTDRAEHLAAVVANDEGQRFQMGNALAQPVNGLLRALGSEGEVEQHIDLGGITRPFGKN